MSKVWFITGASRGIGLKIAGEALTAGECVVATGREPNKITEALVSGSDRLLPIKLDVSIAEQAKTAVGAALQQFGRIDVLVNNAGYGQLGMFEDSSTDEIERQFRVNVFGAMDVTRAVLPVMRKQQSGHIFNISSIAGLRGGAGSSLYCSAKFALEGWSESLAEEVRAFGIHVTSVEPGFFRTDFLDSSSVRYSDTAIPEYTEESAKLRAFFDERSHHQAGDPVKLARALLELSKDANPPRHFLAGTDAIATLEERIVRDQEQLASWRQLSASTDHDS